MKPHPRIRKTVKWVGVVASAALLLLWVASMFWVVDGRGPQNLVFRIGRGKASVILLSDIYPRDTLELSVSTFGFRPPEYDFDCFTGRGGWLGEVPLWFPAAFALVLTAAAWRLDALARRRARAHLCPKCRYDRTGLAPAAICPECGKRASLIG